jgi:NAD(P)-dependent dehydrogenase (short-subunit alcohol dehydrogenase family)
MGGIGQGIVIALTQRDFDVVVGDQTIDPAIAERMTNNAAAGARLSFRNDLTDPGDLPRFADAIFNSLPSATLTVWSIMLAYLRSHKATCSTSPPKAMT